MQSCPTSCGHRGAKGLASLAANGQTNGMYQFPPTAWEAHGFSFSLITPVYLLVVGLCIFFIVKGPSTKKACGIWAFASVVTRGQSDDNIAARSGQPSLSTGRRPCTAGSTSLCHRHTGVPFAQHMVRSGRWGYGRAKQPCRISWPWRGLGTFDTGPLHPDLGERTKPVQV